MEKNLPQSSISKRSIRKSPVIKTDGVRLGTEDKVEVEAYQLGERREVSTFVLDALQASHAKMATALEARMSLFFRSEVTVGLEDFLAGKFYKTSQEVDPAFHLNLFRAEGFSGAGFVGLDTKIALTAVNLLLGGKGEAPKESRSLSKIESDLSADVAAEILGGWKDLWKETLDFDPQIYQQEKSVANFSQCDAHTGVFFARLKVKIRETEGTACLLYPIHMIEAVICRIQEAGHAQKEKAQSLTSQWSPVYGSVPVGPEVRVPGGRMTVDQFLALEPGAVLPLPDQAMDAARMSLAGRPLFSGSFGVHADRLALSLKQKIET
jgi:flagellar motor switch protein FliM